jgi:hypothetical protein
MSYTPVATNPDTARSSAWTTSAFVMAAISVLFLPVVFGPLGIIFAIVGMVKDQPRAIPALITAIAAPVMGMIFGAVVFAASAGY